MRRISTVLVSNSLVLGLVSGLTLGLLATAPAARAVQPASQPMSQPMSQPRTPAVQDACYDYRASGTKAQAATAPAVPCEGPHTAQTFYVGSLPEGFGVPDRANAKARLRAARACTPEAMHTYVGLTNTAIPSRFQIVTVFPTKAQWEAGERWMRCDVVLRGGTQYTRFSGSAQQLVASTPRAQFDFCTPSVPGSRTKSAYPCTKPKRNWIMVAERDLGNVASNFPGSRIVERKAKRICEKIASRYTVRKTFYPWWAIWPTRFGWQDGDRTAQCFVPYGEYLQTTQPAG